MENAVFTVVDTRYTKDYVVFIMMDTAYTKHYAVFSGGGYSPWRMRYVIQYFLFNKLHSHPAMHIEGFNMHDLEGAIHIARSIYFVTLPAICIDRPIYFCRVKQCVSC